MEGSVYFVTWRLAKSQHPLGDGERTIIAEAIKEFDGQRYDLLSYVVMDDHAHTLVAPLETNSLHEIVHAWKSFTANRLQKNFKRLGAIWQREYFDRIVRDEAELIEKAKYILGNPIKRWPEIQEYPWLGCGSWD